MNTSYEAPGHLLNASYNDKLKDFALQYSDYRVPTVEDLDLFQRFDSLLEYREDEDRYYGPERLPVNKALAQRVHQYATHEWALSDTKQTHVEDELNKLKTKPDLTIYDQLRGLQALEFPINDPELEDVDLTVSFWMQRADEALDLSTQLRELHQSQTKTVDAPGTIDDKYLVPKPQVDNQDTPNVDKKEVKPSDTKRRKTLGARIVSIYNKPFDKMSEHFVKPYEKKAPFFDRLTLHIIEKPKADIAPSKKADTADNQPKSSRVAAVSAAVATRYHSASAKAQEYLNDPQDGESRRKLAKVVGFVAVAGGGLALGYLIAKGLHTGESSDSMQNSK